MKQFKLFAWVLAALLLAGSPLHAAKVVLKITKWSEDGILQQYSNNPGTYPVTQEKLSFISFGGAPDDCVRSNGTRIFDTTEAALESGTGENNNGTFTGNEVVRELRKYEDVGLSVDHVLIYREDWLKRGTTGGPWEEDCRILSPQELANVRAAIANSNLESKNTIKLIQLLGARVNSPTVKGNRGDTWFDCIQNPTLMAHLSNFDGIGTECHSGDYTTQFESDGPATLKAMAAIAKWTQDNGKVAHVFMGGTSASYKLPARTRATYDYFWNEMAALGVDKKSNHLIYFRQGARPGDHTPENQNTLTAQIKELIGHVWTEPGMGPGPEPGPTSGLVAHWPLDEGSGSTASDASGYGSVGTLLNGASWGSDATRSSHVVFDGSNDRISTTFRYALSNTDNFTWAWWAKSTLPSTDVTQSGSIMVGNRYGGTGAEDYEFIKLKPEGGAFANTNSTGSIENYDYAAITANAWHHYAMVKNGTSYQWYVDGVAQGSPQTINYNETAPLPFFIGGDDDGSGTKVNEHFKGGIDDVVLYRSALTPQDVSNVMNGIYDLTVTLVNLGDAVPLTAASSWSDAAPAHANANYFIPDTGHLRSEDGTSTFPGSSLTVEAGGRFQVRSKEGSGEVTTVDQLILEGGSSFTSGSFVELAAGTGNNDTNVLDGHITNSGYSRFLTYGKVGSSTINRSLRVQSRIVGSGRIQAFENSADGLSSVIIEYPNNSFQGTWEVAPGSTLVFDDAGAVGTASIEVQSGGVLEIKGNWSTGAELAVADAPATNIKLGTFGWKVSELFIDSFSVGDGVYTAADLNALAAANPVFSGFGTITVGAGLPGGPIAHWKLDESPGTETAIDSSGGGNAGSVLPGASFVVDPTRGPVASFDGNLGRITTDFTYTLSSSDDFTWSWWAKRTATGSDGAIMVGNRYPENRPDGERYEFIKFTPVEAQFANVEDAASIDKYVYPTAVALNEWNHYAMVMSGTEYRWYVNGDLKGTEEFLPYSEDTPIPFNIGGDDNGTGTKTGEHFTGLIDDVVLYDRALPPAEVRGVRNGIYVASPNTAMEDWRELYFGTTENAIPAADDYDANFDGESNLLEFATGQDPYASTLVSTPVERNGNEMEFRYTRSNAAVADGMIFTVEWSDTLLPGSWSSVGVDDIPDPENPGSSEVQARIATMPAGSAGKRFAHLKILKP